MGASEIESFMSKKYETSGEASAKKARTAPSASAKRYDSKKAERERIKMLATSKRGTRPTLPGAM
jgi:hypothetical protein